MLKLDQVTGGKVISVRISKGLDAALDELLGQLKQELNLPSRNAIIVAAIESLIEPHKQSLSPDVRFALKFDQMPRAGRK